MSIFSVSPAKEQELRESMARFGIVEQDIKESFIRASGPGGQNVNKVATGVYIKHIPTGTEVKCFGSRSQALNRFHARRILVSKLEVAILGRKSEERMRVEKIRRQKRKRSKRAKDKMLEGKKMHSEKKELRRKLEI
jgi:protein subunit release factor B